MTTRSGAPRLAVSLAIACFLLGGPRPAEARELTFEDRIAAQAAIEQVYRSRRIWPHDNPGPKPPLASTLPEAALRAKVEDGLRMSQLLDTFWHQPITAEQLAAEIDRIVRETAAPETLREIFAALDNDPLLIAECLARPALAGRKVEALFAHDESLHGAQRAALTLMLAEVSDLAAFDRLEGDRVELTFTPDAGAPPSPSSLASPGGRVRLSPSDWAHELGALASIPVGGVSPLLDRGDRFDVVAVRERSATSVTVATVSWPKASYEPWARGRVPSAALDARAIPPPASGYSIGTPAGGGCADDTWTATSFPGNPNTPYYHTAIWTGAEMISWGGLTSGYLGSGQRYDPATNAWTVLPGGVPNSPLPRYAHNAVWTGSEMIVWGGYSVGGGAPTGGRYNPATSTWAACSLTSGFGANVPPAASNTTAVWTGSEMIVWGGLRNASPYYTNTGGRYNPAIDTWAASSLTAGTGAYAPSGRFGHTAVWTGSEMIVWGGAGESGLMRTGGRYTPATDTWTFSTLFGGSGGFLPSVRYQHTAVWTGTEMIVWGGYAAFANTNPGGRYDPAIDTWLPSSLTYGTGPNVPHVRQGHSALWTGSEMILWGGTYYDTSEHNQNTGGRYDPTYDEWLPSSLFTGSGVNVPSPRHTHTAVFTGAPERRMIVWGGYPQHPNGGVYCARECTPLTWYPDADGDGHGVSGVTQSACRRPAGFAAAPDDCDDAHAATYPGAAEVCDGLDNDCDAATPIDPGGDALCDDANACTDGVCGGLPGCVYTNNTNLCDDGDPCTTADSCGAGICDGAPDSGNACNDGNACTLGDTCLNGSCLPGGGTLACDDHSVCTADSCEPSLGCVYDASSLGDMCDDGNPCTLNGCDPVELCVFPPAPATFLCNDFDVCTEADRCDGQGGCAGGVPTNCDDNNPCTDDACDSATGCTHTNNTGACNDHNACTTVDTCAGGLCYGSIPVVCQSLDVCHRVGVCNTVTGACSNPTWPDGTLCQDGDLCTSGETCQTGTCTPAQTGLNHPAPKSSGHYAQLCQKRDQGQLPWHGDELTDPDALCVAGLTATFDDLVTVDDLCAVIGHGAGGNVCSQGEDELIATALNICRARVCEAQALDSRCHGTTSTTVDESFADADALLDAADRTSTTCQDATCELREINNGHALEMNSLTLNTEAGGVRLSWIAPELDDGAGPPEYYEVWRRPLRSPAAFDPIGTTTEPTYLDATPGATAWEYEITAVMP